MPEILRVGVQMALSVMYDGKLCDDHLDKCSHRGSGNIRRAGYQGEGVRLPDRPQGDESGEGEGERKGRKT